MQIKILFTGCSYFSGTPSVTYVFDSLLKKENIDSQIISACSPGNSNTTIIKNVYDLINEYNVTDSIVFCQLTHLHRIGFFHDIIDNWVDYQPEWFTSKPKLNEITKSLEFNYKIEQFENKLQTYGTNSIFPSKDIENKLRDAYTSYLTFVYNELETFKYLMYKVDLLSSYCLTKNCKIFFLYWPLIKSESQINELSKRSFISIENNFSILDYTTKNNLINKDDSHLSLDGLDFMSKILYNYVK